LYGPGPGSGFFNQQAKKVRKTLIFTILMLLYDFLSIKTDINVPSISKKQKTLEKNIFFVGFLSAIEGKSRIRIRIRKCHGSTTKTKLPMQLCCKCGLVL
jgi:hypothetical protein